MAKKNLPSHDFLFGFMNEEMEYVMKTYGKKNIFMDGTHGINPYQYELTTVLILDDKNKRYFCIH
jgi:CRISPR/Cas system-associated protein Csx1